MAKRIKAKLSLPQLGWKEDVFLPELHTTALVAKVDTGARLSALHADDITIRGSRVSFRIEGSRHVKKLRDTKLIKSSNGQSELRPVIETVVMLGELRFIADITLTNRTDMGVPMLLGREAIKGRFLVNAGRTFILSKKALKP